jgi:hypothetical protein
MPYRGEQCPWSKLTDAIVQQIRRGADACMALAERNGVAHTTVLNVRRRKTRTHI